MSQTPPPPLLNVVYTTCDTLESAQNLARGAISQKLAVCANIIPQGVSIYMWEDQICEDQEVYMIFKTTEERHHALMHFIKKQHPYDTPAILVISHTQTTKDFFHFARTHLS